jgi:uncharacterized heparinase superfamily protein
MRAVSLARRRWLQWRGGGRYMRPAAGTPRLRANDGFRSILAWKLDVRRARNARAKSRQILDDRFTFLGETHTLHDPLDWRLESWPGIPRLWRFHLHYHEFLLDLAAAPPDAGAPELFDRAWQIIDAWIAQNRLSDPRVLDDAWHPYCISRRLPVWTVLWSAYPPDKETATRVFDSMATQARFLRDHLEWDVCGNHLLENAKAMGMVGAFLEGPEADRLLFLAEKLLRRQLAAQILLHGEHFERSPMYHAIALESLLDVRDAARSVAPPLADFCAAIAGRMADFLREILHPDGEIPLLGDSCFDECPPGARLIARAETGGAPQAEDIHGDCPDFRGARRENGTVPLRPARPAARGAACPGDGRNLGLSRPRRFSAV